EVVAGREGAPYSAQEQHLHPLVRGGRFQAAPERRHGGAVEGVELLGPIEPQPGDWLGDLVQQRAMAHRHRPNRPSLAARRDASGHAITMRRMVVSGSRPVWIALWRRVETEAAGLLHSRDEARPISRQLGQE